MRYFTFSLSQKEAKTKWNGSCFASGCEIKKQKKKQKRRTLVGSVSQGSCGLRCVCTWLGGPSLGPHQLTRGLVRAISSQFHVSQLSKGPSSLFVQSWTARFREALYLLYMLFNNLLSENLNQVLFFRFLFPLVYTYSTSLSHQKRFKCKPLVIHENSKLLNSEFLLYII
jgi:hypothetical protein